MALFVSRVPIGKGGIHKIIRLCKADQFPNLTFNQEIKDDRKQPCPYLSR